MGPKLVELDAHTKGQIIGQLQAGRPGASVALEFGTSPATVCRLKRKFEGSGSTDRKPGSGAARKTTERDDRAIVRAARINHEITGEEIKVELNLNHCSERTIRRRITEGSDMKSYWKTKKPFISPQNRIKRVRWAKEHRDWTPKQWGNFLLTDESPYVLRFNKRGRVWRSHNERYQPWATRATIKHDKKINVWGGFAAHEAGLLHRIEGKQCSRYICMSCMCLLCI